MRDCFSQIKLTIVLSLVFFLALSTGVFASELSELRELLEEQKRVIELLEKRVGELERQGAGDVGTRDKPYTSERELQELRHKVERIEESRRLEIESRNELQEMRSQFGRNLGAFGDVNYATDSRERINRTFTVGSFGLYSTASYNDRLNFVFEAVIVPHNDHSTVNLERLWAGYTLSDELVVRAGRFHAALGYWNKTYHHGRNLFLTLDRPFFLKFEDTSGVVPVHVVGLEVAGVKDLSSGKLKYWFQFGNGPSVKKDPHSWFYSSTKTNKLAPNTMLDNNDSKQSVVRLAFEPAFIKGLKLGAFATYFTVEGSARSATKFIRVHEAIGGVDLYYKRDRLEVIGEYYRFRNGKEEADAYYIQTAYSLGKLTPYGRYERLHSTSRDPYMSVLTGGGNRHQYIAGVRYELDFLHSSLKAQFRYDYLRDMDTFNVYEFQWAFYF
jgi:hypothetical protein